jgi:O-acetylhomoserine (thiol)-lyase
MDFETRAIHEGQEPDPATGAIITPIYQTSTYVQDAVGEHKGYDYSRVANPTRHALETALASLESAEHGIAYSSGLGATTTLMHLLNPGDRVVLIADVYGGVYRMTSQVYEPKGYRFHYLPADEFPNLAEHLDDSTRMVWIETPSNPLLNVVDIAAAAEATHAAGALLVVDNTFATPYLCRPIDFGADIVVHSATKFLGGHGTSLGGVVVESGEFDWSNGRFPVVAEPSPAYHGLQFHETFGTYGYLMKLRAETLRDLGAAMSPFNAFLFLQGLETLSLRMARHVDNAAAVASYLESHALASQVTYPGLRSSKYRPLVEKYLPLGAGAVFSFDCRGGRAAGQDFIRGVTLWSHLANVGDSKSLIIHPASTTHRQLGEEELRAAGVGPGTIRLSVGIEAIDDLIWDLEQGFARAAAAAPTEVASL